MIVVFDWSGVLFNKGMQVATKRISAKFNITPEKVEEILNGGFAEEYRTGLIESEAFWKKVKKEVNLNNVEEFKQLFFDAYVLSRMTLNRKRLRIQQVYSFIVP